MASITGQVMKYYVNGVEVVVRVTGPFTASL